MKASDLLERHETLWSAATEHPFLHAVRDGGLPQGTFACWLGQDYQFVMGLLAFHARLLVRAPRDTQGVLATGCVALENELTWLERYAAERDIDLAVTPLPATLDYCALLSQLDRAPYLDALAARWAIAAVYFVAWQHALPGAPDYAEPVVRWTQPAFAEYVTSLECAVDAELRAPHADASAAERAFLQVVRYERAIWDMAYPCDASVRVRER